MRKKVSGLILCFALLFTLPLHAYAANKVDTIDIEAVLYKDGSMYVTQVWEGDFDEGTESYIPMNAPETLTISQLTVSDQNGVYETVPNWNIDWCFEEVKEAAGSDAILLPKELERFANQNDTLLRAYIEEQDSTGRAYLSQKHCLKRYLTDFSLIAERGVKEMPIWRELLTYAMLFGIANQVAEQMKALNPQISNQLTDYSQRLPKQVVLHEQTAGQNGI